MYGSLVIYIVHCHFVFPHFSNRFAFLIGKLIAAITKCVILLLTVFGIFIVCCGWLGWISECFGWVGFEVITVSLGVSCFSEKGWILRFTFSYFITTVS
jgi:hypothetical protein